MAFFQKGLNEVHPEIINIPGRVEDDGNSHLNLGSDSENR
jgi:hypothetical protein